MSNIYPFQPKPKEKYLIGGRVDAAKVSLRVFGDDLQPETISQQLKATPDYACQKGDPKRFKKEGLKERTGKWILNGRLPEHYTLEEQIRGLLTHLNDDLKVWHKLAQDHRMDLFCGVMMGGFNEHFILSPELSQELSKRHLKLHIDIYGDLD